MKFPFLLAGALLLSAPALAQAQPIESSGYDLLVQAGSKILPGPNGGASNTDPAISSEENLRRERLAVARNAPALALVRRALQKPIEIPEAQAGQDIPFNSEVRELARQFSQESDVRLADGDSAGAMNSKLDAMELGAVVGHGALISLLVGIAVEAIGNNGADKVASHLDATQCRRTLERLTQIEAKRSTLANTLRQEQKINLRFTLDNFSVPVEVEDLKPGQNGEGPTAEQIAQFKALTPTKITARLFDAAVALTQLPYIKAIATKLPQDIDPLNKALVDVLQGEQYRFSYDRTTTQNRLLRCGLKLRIQQIEKGAYPKALVPPIDPFSPSGHPLIYKKTSDEGYLLYSVGPDGKDDGGEEISTVTINDETGVRTVTQRLRPDSTGDIVQNPF